ncbi:MAG: aminopeptidase P family protein [Oscillospiraceae bacterium]|jgi:Xaa-Pro aminopeptidase|nr:aminopeptidase P family protein [Oscillospiraceae bacterium]
MPCCDQIRTALPNGTAAWVSSPANCQYFSGFAADNCLCLLSKHGAYYLTDRRFLEAAQKTVTTLEVRDIEQLDALLSELPERRFAVEAEHTTLAALLRRKKRYPKLDFSTEDGLDKLIADLRTVKTTQEIASIRCAQMIAEQALAQILPNIRVGRMEKEIALELDFAMLSLGAEAMSFDTIAVGGENGSLPHGVPSARTLHNGDLLTLDFGAVVNGYHSDMTRTFAVGEPGEEQRKVYALVLAAQEAGICAIRPGTACKDVDAAVRAVFDAAGMGAYFVHSTGHGVGLEIHEAPTLSKNSDDILREGMVVTVEPGLYLPGRFGVRIENMVVVGNKAAAHHNAGGCVNLTEFSKVLQVL